MGAEPPDPPASTSDIVHATNLSTCVLVVLTIAWSLGGHQLAQRCKYLTEGSAACALGLATGVVLLLGHEFLDWEIVTQLLEFNAAGFFTYLLPPVIFYAGLSVEKSRFFLALPSILMSGVFGTLASFIIISLFMYLTLGFALFKMEDCLAMGAIFAATDSVATLQVLNKDAMPSLFALVFGEGVVNDAVSVVLLGAVAAAANAHGSAAAAGGSQHRLAGGIVANFIWLLVTSLLLGSAAGLGIAVALKKLHLQGAHQELAVVALLSYLSYLLADVSGLSAILSLFVCGVVVSHYALHNVSPEGRHATLTSFQTASHLAEGLIFLYLGMDCLDPLKWQGANAVEVVWLVVVLTVLLVAARAAFVVPFALLHNCWSAPADRLSRRDVVIVWWAGLMRGAVSVALVYYYFDDNPRQMLDKGRATLIVTTLMVVMLSILGFGAFTKPLLAAMLQGDGESDALAAQLSKIPLLGNLARHGSAGSLFGAGGDASFHSQGSGSNNNWHRLRQQTNSTSSRPDSRDGTPRYSAPAQDSSSSGGGGGSRMYHSSSANNNNGGNGSSSGWTRGLSVLLPQARGGSNVGAGGGGRAAVGMQPLQSTTAAPAAAQDDGFAGFDAPGDTGGTLFTLDGDVATVTQDTPSQGGGGGQQQQQQQQQQQPWVTVQPAQQQQQQVHVELQEQQSRGEAEADTTSSSMLAAMRHVGNVWGEFDRNVMQPVFGGPDTTRGSSSQGGGAGVSQQQRPPGTHPL